jgi:hypothetical protein
VNHVEREHRVEREPLDGGTTCDHRFLLLGYSFFICFGTAGQAARTVDIFFRYVDRRSGSRTYIRERDP